MCMTMQDAASEQALRERKQQIRENIQYREKTVQISDSRFQNNEFIETELDPVYKTFTSILEADYQSEAWITKKAGKRNAKKNIKEDYKAVFGQRRSGLKDPLLNSRKADIEEHKNLSREASGRIIDLLSENREEEKNNIQQLITEFQDMDIKEFAYGDSGFKSDEAFVKGFSEKMKILIRGQELYERLQSGENIPELTEEARNLLMPKLGVMGEIRQVYEDRIRIISSAYYTSLRDADFTTASIRVLKKANQKKGREGSIKAYAEAMIRWKEKGEKLIKDPQKAIDEIVSFRQLEDQSDLTVKRTIEKMGMDEVKASIQDNRKEIREIRNRMDIIYDPQMTDDQIFEKFSKMKSQIRKKIREYEQIPPEKLTYGGLNVPSLKKVLSHVESMEKQFGNGAFSKDTVQLFLDRTLMLETKLKQHIYDTVILQNEPDMSPAELKTQDLKYKKELGDLAASFINQIGNGFYGYFQNRKDPRFVKKGDNSLDKKFKKEKKNRIDSAYKDYLSKNQEASKADKSDELDKIKDQNSYYGQKVPLGSNSYNRTFQLCGKDFLHFRGSHSDPANVLTRAYLSVAPGKKLEGVKAFMSILQEQGIAQYVHFKVSTSILENRVDDITVYFDKGLTVDETKACLDKFNERCKDILLGGQEMSVTASQYAKGIGLAAEPDLCGMINMAAMDNPEICDPAFIKNVAPSPTYSYTTFVSEMLCKSILLANKRMGKNFSENNLELSEKMLPDINKIFRELCVLNGMDPATMMDLDMRNVISSKRLQNRGSAA